MSDTAEKPGEATEGRTSVTKRGGGSAGTRGRTTIADGVVEKIAGLAARDVMGVHAMGSGLSAPSEPYATGCPAAPNPCRAG